MEPAIRKISFVIPFVIMVSTLSAQLESWSGWGELDSDQQAAFLDELSEWLEQPLTIQTLTRATLNDLPISSTCRIRVLEFIRDHPDLTKQTLLDLLDPSGWDYAVLSAVLTDKKINTGQHYRLRISNGAGKNDQQYRQTVNAKFKQFQIAGLFQHSPTDGSFRSTTSGGILYELKNERGRLYMGNYRLDLGLGLAIRHSAFVSGAGLNQIVPAIRQRVKLHQSAQTYGFFNGIAFQRNVLNDESQLLVYFSQVKVPGRFENDMFRPYPASQATDLAYQIGSTVGMSLVYRNDSENLVTHLGFTADRLASNWNFPLEFDLSRIIGRTVFTYGAGWNGGDTLAQLLGLQINGSAISTAISFWRLGWFGKSRFRLSAPIGPMENENSQGAGLGFRIRLQNATLIEISSAFQRPLVLQKLDDEAWKQILTFRAADRSRSIFWKIQQTQTGIPIQKLGVQFSQQHDAVLQIIELFKISLQNHNIGGLAGLRIKYSLEQWQFYGGLLRFVAHDFEVRQYAYESDVTNAFSVPLYYGDGVRIYAVGRYTESFWKLEFKIGQWRQYDQDQTQNKFDGALQLSIVF